MKDGTDLSCASRLCARITDLTFTPTHRIVDNMPVTWCYEVEDSQKFCNPGFPIGCYITDKGHAKDACVISVSVW